MGGRFLYLDASDQPRRGEEGDGVDQHGDGRADGLDEQAAGCRSDHEGPRPSGAEQRVRLDVLVPADQRNEERGICGLVDRPRGTGHQGDHDELGERDCSVPVSQREGEDGQPLDQMAEYQQGPLAWAAVDPGAGEHRHQVRRPDRGGDDTHLGWGGVQCRDRDERDRQLGDSVAEVGDSLGGPVRREAPVAVQRRVWRIF